MDVDGTLTDAKETIHPMDTALLQAFPTGIQPVLTTGRSLLGARAVLRHNGLFQVGPLPLPGVFMNGGAAYLPGEVLREKHTLSQQTLAALLGLTKMFTQTAFTFFSLERVFLVNPNPFARHISQIHYLEAAEVDPERIPEEVVKLMILDQNRDSLAKIKGLTTNLQVEGAYSLPYAFEINPPGITKANTLVSLLKTMGLEDLPVYIVGDGENDLSLFKGSVMSFAPSSAHPAVLTAADHIIPREKDGLLQSIFNIMADIV